MNKIRINSKLNPIGVESITQMRDGLNALQSATDLMLKGAKGAIDDNLYKIRFYDTSMAWLTCRISSVEKVADKYYVNINGSVLLLEDLAINQLYAVVHSITTENESTKDFQWNDK